MLCYRCEHRAKSLEAKARDESYQPRYECGEHVRSLCACYMFTPCMPVVTRPQDGDKRPRYAGALLSAREEAVRVMDADADALALKVVYRKRNEVALAWGAK